jgi:hypothetical protein
MTSCFFRPLPHAFIAVGMWAALAVQPANAHETWLTSTQKTVVPGKELSFDMTSGEHFPSPGTSIARERIDVARCRQGNKDFELLDGRRDARSLRLNATPPGRGGVSCWVRLLPRTLDLDISKVQGYLDEIDAPASVRGAWAASPEPRRWNEVYAKNAEIVVPQKSADARSPKPAPPPAQPASLNLAFLPGSDLSTGDVRGALEVTLVRDGKPLPDISVALSGNGQGAPLRQRSDAQGRVSFPAPAAGRWMLSATDLRVVDVAQGRWESQFATLVFEVLK